MTETTRTPAERLRLYAKDLPNFVFGDLRNIANVIEYIARVDPDKFYSAEKLYDKLKTVVKMAREGTV